MGKSILYIGSLKDSCNSFRRFQTLQAMGHTVSGIDIDPYIYRSLFIKFHYLLNIGPGIWALNKEIISSLEKKTPDILWVDNKPFLQPSTLKKIRKTWPSIKIVNLITDDPAGKYKFAWRLCLITAKYYDFHFVQREVNIRELKKYGAQRVELCYRSYDPSFHRPIELSKADEDKYKVQVGFVGTHERYREEYIVHLIKNNIAVSITGNDWPNAKNWEVVKPFYKGPSIYNEGYIKTINGMDIALHFLRHVNRDEQDSRTFEIPACGVFMLAEKSGVHLDLFENGKEAIFFETKEELLEKVKFYLENSVERKAIAVAGLERSKSSGYSHAQRLKGVVDIINS